MKTKWSLFLFLSLVAPMLSPNCSAAEAIRDSDSMGWSACCGMAVALVTGHTNRTVTPTPRDFRGIRWFTAKAAPPPSSIDLSRWKLTLPVNADGKLGGHAEEVSAQRLAAGYSHPDFFQINAHGAITFWTPVTGATTDNSEFPRSELREMLDPLDESINWPARGVHVLEARCRVTQLPGSRKVIIGQIHSFTGKALPLLKLQYFKDRIEALVKRSPTKGGDRKFELARVELNSPVAYQIRLENGELSLTVDKHTVRANVLESDPTWGEQTFYFKAGAYCQDNDGPATEGARVTFSQIRVTHSVAER